MTEEETEPAEASLHALGAQLRELRPAYPIGKFAGRGIVIAAGGPQIFTNAYVLVHILRRTLGSRLPIEVWHLGASELSRGMAALLAELDVTTVDAVPLLAESGVNIRDGWQLKSFAVMASSFEEVLLLDADQVPIDDPRPLFDWPQYRETGAVFWPDIVDIRKSNAIWKELGLDAIEAVSFESGQVLIDKARHWRALSVTLRLNEAAEQVYQLIYGDKDTFLVGWKLADADFALVPHRPFVDERLLVQRDFAGRPLFQHRTNAKWSYGGQPQHIDGFVHFEACLAAIEGLRERWNGRVFNPPGRGMAALIAEAELVREGRFTLEIIADEVTKIQLQRFGELGAGRSHDRQNWWIEGDAENLRLVISDRERRTYQFEWTRSGRWQGRRLRRPDAEALLTPDSQLGGLPAVPWPETPTLVDDFLRACNFPATGDQEWERLAAALQLLSRLDSGVAARLERLAGDYADSNPVAASRLADLGQRIADTAGPDRREVQQNHGVLKMGYHRPRVPGE